MSDEGYIQTKVRDLKEELGEFGNRINKRSREVIIMARKISLEVNRNFDKIPIVKTARGENQAVFGIPESSVLPPPLKLTS